ncbi:MAG: prepilin-type N-terminal cleavage/methylation domain-containing protein [Phycisphaerales bacterium]|nr:prepilin-type N-terminal cleavage/methylation domain-containing protein [Phycisphaerales bacterium]
MRRAFTLIELLVVIAIMALLMGILLPTLSHARFAAKTTVCGSRLQQIGLGLSSYLADFKEALPQAKGPLPSGGDSVIGALFGGKKGILPFYGIDQIGAERRPLNKYISSKIVAADEDPQVVEMEEFKSPVDKGCGNTGIPVPGLDQTNSYYDFIGSSYTLNDHSLEGEWAATLVPMTANGPGGKMPQQIRDTTKTWVIGTHTIYNYQEDGDRESRWFGPTQVQANLLYLDFHVRLRVNVPPGIVNETPDYTFLP